MQLNFKKVIKHTFPNFVERYRVLKTNFLVPQIIGKMRLMEC